ncbi:hypothetical protein SDC9_87543 [bioreactor metagenome]|uniref:Uncharacterized protein n=1 Tax=bioreactor metagenome TaxID=1076179 RepID=A0A644ZTJ3_9ZZZZ
MRIGQDISGARDDKARPAAVERIHRLAVCALRLGIVEHAYHAG